MTEDKQQLKDANPPPSRIKVGDEEIILRAPDLNALAELEEYFGVSFTEIERILKTDSPKFFRDIRQVILALVHMDHPKITAEEVGRAITMDNLKECADSLALVFSRANPLGEENPGETEET